MKFRLLGRVGKNLPKLRIVDLREQRGIYVLYGNHGASYVGLATENRLGYRLRDHHGNKAEWEKFSWFAFDEVLLEHTDENGICVLQKRSFGGGDTEGMIKDVEAILIKVLNTKNIKDARFGAAREWAQVGRADIEHYLQRAQRQAGK